MMRDFMERARGIHHLLFGDGQVADWGSRSRPMRWEILRVSASISP